MAAVGRLLQRSVHGHRLGVYGMTPPGSIWSGGVNSALQYGGSIGANAWRHYSFVATGSVLYIYIDGYTVPQRRPCRYLIA